jgi:hypothetical protein
MDDGCGNRRGGARWVQIPLTLLLNFLIEENWQDHALACSSIPEDADPISTVLSRFVVV